MAAGDTIYALAGQVQGLELVMKSIITMHLASQVKDDAGFARAAEIAETMSRRLQESVEEAARQANERGIDPRMIELMQGEARKTVARCYDQNADMMRKAADVVLDLSTPPTDARN